MSAYYCLDKERSSSVQIYLLGSVVERGGGGGGEEIRARNHDACSRSGTCFKKESMTADADGSDARSTLSHRTQHAILLNKVPGESAVELALVFFPAGGVDGEVYTPLMHIIQVPPDTLFFNCVCLI